MDYRIGPQFDGGHYFLNIIFNDALGGLNDKSKTYVCTQAIDLTVIADGEAGRIRAEKKLQRLARYVPLLEAHNLVVTMKEFESWSKRWDCRCSASKALRPMM